MSRTLPEKCNIFVIGDGMIGKTCLLWSYAKNVFLGDQQEYVRTIIEKYVADVEIRLPVPPSAAVRKSILASSAKEELTAKETETIFAASKAFDALFTQPYASDPSKDNGRGGRGGAAAGEDDQLMRTTERLNLALYDTAGQEQYAGIRKMLFGGVDDRAEVPSNASSGKSSHKHAASAVERNRRPTAKATALSSPSVPFRRGPPIVVVCFAWDKPESLNSVEGTWNKELQTIESMHRNSNFTSSYSSGGGSASSSGNTHRPFVVVLCATRMDTAPPAGSTLTAEDEKKFCKWKDVLAVKRTIGADVFVPCSSKTGQGVKQVFEAGLLVWATRAREEAARKAAAQERGSGCAVM